jgi:hypothetical protein
VSIHDGASFPSSLPQRSRRHPTHVTGATSGPRRRRRRAFRHYQRPHDAATMRGAGDGAHCPPEVSCE